MVEVKAVLVLLKKHQNIHIKYNLLCAISSNKIIGWKLYKDIKGGIKTDNIIEFYNENIKNKYTNHLIIMDNAVTHRSQRIKELIKNSNNHL